ENSEVLPLGSVAVAVMIWPPTAWTGRVTSKLAWPLASVVTFVEPRKNSPSSFIENGMKVATGSLAKNSMRNTVLGDTDWVNVPLMRVAGPGAAAANVRTGEF